MTGSLNLPKRQLILSCVVSGITVGCDIGSELLCSDEVYGVTWRW